MSHKSVVVVVCVLLASHSASVFAEQSGAAFQDEVRVSCERYAVEDKIPPQDVRKYIDRCMIDFSKPQSPDDESLLLEMEDGIGAVPPADEPPLDEGERVPPAPVPYPPAKGKK